MKKVLNVGGQDKNWTPTMEYYEDFDGYEQVMLDIDPETNADIICDARELKTLAPEQFDGVWCSHNLEHYSSTEILGVLEGFLHVLKPGGKVVIVVPDIVMAIVVMLHNNDCLMDTFYVAGDVLPVTYADVLYGSHTIMTHGKPYYKHHYGFSVASLQRWMDLSGFKGSCVVNPNDNLNVWYRGHKG